MCFSDSGDRFDTPLHYTQTTFNIFTHVVTPPRMHANPQHSIKPEGGCTFQTLPCRVSKGLVRLGGRSEVN